MQTEYQELLEEVQRKMRDLGEKPELLGQVIRETLDRHSDALIDIAVQETLHWTTSELYNCTLEQVAFDVLDYELGQDYLRDVPDNEGRFEIYDDTFEFTMTDNDDNPLLYNSIEEAEEEIHGWFSQQDDTLAFTIYDRVLNESVKTIEREEDEDTDG